MPQDEVSGYGEPWYYHEPTLRILDATGQLVAGPSEGETLIEGEHMQRAIACVNACAGIPTEKLAEAVMAWKLFDGLKREEAEEAVKRYKRPFAGLAGDDYVTDPGPIEAKLVRLDGKPWDAPPTPRNPDGSYKL